MTRQFVIYAVLLHVWWPFSVVAQEKITYDEHVKAVFRQKCSACHNPDKRSGDLDLTNYTGVMQGGGSGEVVEPGDSSSSYLYMLITHEEEPAMPPESPKIPDEMIATVRDWIDGGALENASSKAHVAKKPGKSFVAAAAGERPAQVATPGRLSKEPVVQTEQRNAITAIATSPWAPLVAVGGQRQVLLYQSKPTELLGVLPFQEGEVHVLKFSQDGSLLLAGGGQGAAAGRTVVWDVRSGERVLRVGDELDTVLAADLSANLRLVAMGGPGRVVRVHSTETAKVKYEVRKHTDWIQALAFSPDGVLLATADRNGGLFVWEAYSGREYLALKGHGSAITALSWRSDSNVLASCSEDGSVKLWEMENGGQIKNWGAHGGGVACVEFSRDGRLVTCGRDRVAKLWDANGKVLRSFDAFQDLALRTTFCDETNGVIAGDWRGELRVWDVADGKLLGQLDTNPPLLSQRVVIAQAELARQDQVLQETSKETLSARQAHEQLANSMQDTEQLVERLTTELASSQQTATNARQEVVQMTAVTEESAATIQRLEPVVPNLNEAAARAMGAAEAAPGDQELAVQAAKLDEIARARSAQLTQATEEQKTAFTLLPEKQKKLATAESESQRLATERDAVVQQREAMREPLAKAMESREVSERTFNQQQQQRDIAEKQLVRWQDEVEFTVVLGDLRGQRSAASEDWLNSQTALAEQMGVVRAAEQAVRDVTAATEQARLHVQRLQNQLAETETALADHQESIQQLDATRESNADWMNRQQQAIELLAQAVKSLQGALALNTADEGLQNTYEQLQATSAQQMQRLKERQAEQTQLAEQVQTLKAEMQEQTQRIKEFGEQLITANQEGEVATEKLAEVQNQLAQTRQVADQISDRSEQLLNALDEARRQVRILQGLEKPDSATQVSAGTVGTTDSDG